VNHIVALSGGKDSTALALRLAEVEPRDYTYLITPTGDELPPMLEHWQSLEKLLGKPLTRITNGTLNGWIEHYNALPNWRQRWCTRLLKIEPAIAFYKAHMPCTAYVGLRADEDADERTGIYGLDIQQRYPLREWGWNVDDVWRYLYERGVRIPKRTDCARCYGQRISEWEQLDRDYPDVYTEAVTQEARTGKTFRSPGRDSRPAGLAELRVYFASKPKSLCQGQLFEEMQPCRVCSL
jgi:hypothetical protein